MTKIQVDSNGKAIMLNNKALEASEGGTLITKTITENGTYNASSDNADGYSSVTVNVSGGGTKYGMSLDSILGDTNANGVLQLPNTNGNMVFNDVADIGSNALYYRFYYNTAIKSCSFPSLTEISGDAALSHTFQYCTGLTSASFPNLTTVSGNNAMNSAFLRCSNLTSVDLSNLTTINTGNNANGMHYTFQYCTSLTTVDLSNLTTVIGRNAMDYIFAECTSLNSVDLSSLTTVNGNNAMVYAFQKTKIKTLSFPALTSNSFGSYTNQFYRMLYGVTGCTVHFPSNLQSVIGSWSDVTAGFGGTNTTILFDLPSTT